MRACTLIRPLGQSSKRRALHTSSIRMDEESLRLKDLYAKFQDPTSHYHIPPGTNGPEHEEDHSTNYDPRQLSRSSPPRNSSHRSPSNRPSSARLGVPETRPSIQWSEPSSSSGSGGSPTGSGKRSTPNDRSWLDERSGNKKAALAYFREQGYDTAGVLTWPVAWGDCDTYRHVNNVRFLEWIQSARIRYAESWASEMPEGYIAKMTAGKGTGFILKDVSIKYVAPVNYPDTVMVTNQIHAINPEKASYGHKHLVWSLRDERVAAVCDSTIVMYDYDNLKKGTMSDEFRKMLENIVDSYGQ
ncbi:uncharacterized protein I303_100148 [Kwoniella dejecticola CBS 10117]|uniref:Thioesterase n=1 Tax=Kwoniella dejecticola CBS 10117 TaxID=1296121 RepID=A0A1A6AE36_9TREE|nr:uncharacterized protein I303_00148 [Kwoniella dejecticola CBS 10117]OBR88337.1 hypothetical protein I303_00148 [Kwoniella dejecticola CBS 10117]